MRGVVVVLGFVLFATAASAQSRYLFDLLKNEPYHTAWTTMFAGEKGLSPWLRDYQKTQVALEMPSKTVTINDQSYTSLFVCKMHECGPNQFYVLFSPQGDKAWGLLKPAGRWFGKPDPAIKDALMKSSLVHAR